MQSRGTADIPVHCRSDVVDVEQRADKNGDPTKTAVSVSEADFIGVRFSHTLCVYVTSG